MKQILLLITVFLLSLAVGCGPDVPPDIPSQTPEAADSTHTADLKSLTGVWRATATRILVYKNEADDTPITTTQVNAADYVNLQIFGDGYFDLEVGQMDFFGKAMVVGNGAILYLKPDDAKNLKVSISKEGSLVLHSSRREASELFATIIVASGQTLTPELIDIFESGKVTVEIELQKKKG